MKTQLTIIFAFVTFLCFGQAQKNNHALYDLTIDYKPAVITILTDTGIVNSSINNGNISKITYRRFTPGQYKVQVSGRGQQTIIKDSIVVEKGQDLVLSFTFNGPCLYDHPANYTPTCPENHTDSIIPIVYGFIATRGNTYITDKSEMKIKYAGCVLTGCDPQFYCKKHDIEF